MFKNRIEAGKLLVNKISSDLGQMSSKETIVLAIPRGGVIVGKAVSDSLNCPMDVIIVKKLQALDQPELAIGAVGKTPASLFKNEPLISELEVGDEYLEKEILDKQKEIKSREELYRGKRSEQILENKNVIVVDDGAATGATMISALRQVWGFKPKKVIVALPVCPLETLEALEKEADAVIVLDVPELFYAVGQYYEEFPQVEDFEVIKILEENSK